MGAGSADAFGDGAVAATAGAGGAGAAVMVTGLEVASAVPVKPSASTTHAMLEPTCAGSTVIVDP